MYQLKQEVFISLNHVVEIARVTDSGPDVYGVLKLSDGKTLHYLSEYEMNEVLDAMGAGGSGPMNSVEPAEPPRG
ncbi:MAG: hypothetical protein JST11_29880 [Acidobacteria bacterium]|nr:hypothetical protein [Acidobacteriota bacterium]